MDEDTIRKNIRKAREAMGLSQQKMAEMMKVSRTAYRNLECGGTAILGKAFSSFLEVSSLSFEAVASGHTGGEVDTLLRESRAIDEQRKEIIRDYEKMLEEKNGEITRKNGTIKEMERTISSMQSNIKSLENYCRRLELDLSKHEQQ